MKRIYKGEKGYIKFQTKIEIIKTVFMLALSVGCYFLGIYIKGDNKNLLTFVAILGALPMAKFCVNAIMFLRAKGISEALYEKVNIACPSGVLYDLYLTDYKKNYQLSALLFKKGSIIAISEDENVSVLDAEAHIKMVLANVNITNVTVKVFKEESKFLERLAQVATFEEEESSKKTIITDNILSVSL